MASTEGKTPPLATIHIEIDLDHQAKTNITLSAVDSAGNQLPLHEILGYLEMAKDPAYKLAAGKYEGKL